MLDIKFIRDNSDIIKEAVKKKHVDLSVDKLIEVDDKRRDLLREIETERSRHNQINNNIAKENDEEARRQLIVETRILKDKLQLKEEELKKVTKKWQKMMLEVPNIPDVSVPAGKTDAENQPIRSWGEKPEFSFSPRDHIDLLMTNGWVDTERGVKVSGFRGYFLTGLGVSLSMAIWQWAMNRLSKKGYKPFLAPSLLKREPFLGTGYVPQGEEDLYKTQDGTYLAGTSEVALMGCFMEENLGVGELPIKAVAFSPCFRREAGSHGRDTKGLIRVHEFYKVEQIIIGEADHQLSVKYHQELTEQAEELMQELRLQYQVVVNCGGDLGLGAVKKHDIEVWMPSEDKYRETHSISYFHDWQTRRLNIKYRDREGRNRLAHSLNGTATATPRLIAAIAENYQQPDGSIAIPEVLKPYLQTRTDNQITG